jgi:hypothetical protein
MGTKFTLHRGTYRFYLDGRMAYQGKKIAVVIDSKTGTVHKHGPVDDVKASFDELHKAMGDHIVMVTSDNWPLDELDKLVSIADYGKALLEKVGY